VTNPSVIQDALDECLAQVTSPQQLLPLVLTKTARRLNLDLSELEIQRLTTAILNAEGNVLQLDLEPPCAMGETEEEIQTTVQWLIDELVESMPNFEENIAECVSRAVPDALSKAAELIGDEISDQALKHTLHLREAQSNRTESVQRIWGAAIEQLDFMRHMMVEWNSTAIELRKGAYTNPNTAFALSRLVLRAYEVVGEILTLVRAGYADGALARWRSVHEICVVAMFLANRSDRCAQMYLSHHEIEELRLLAIDKASGTTSVKNTHLDSYVRDLRKHKAAMIRSFGTSFASDYGWASVDLGRTKTTFRDLESHVGLEKLRRGYQQANSIVHGGALATLSRISLGPGAIDGTEVPPAYGCEVATDYATASLSMMIAELCLETGNADLVTMSLVVHNCASKVRQQIEYGQQRVSANSVREKLLIRKVAQRELRAKSRRISQRR
jgi:hypothetical protein